MSLLHHHASAHPRLLRALWADARPRGGRVLARCHDALGWRATVGSGLESGTTVPAKMAAKPMRFPARFALANALTTAAIALADNHSLSSVVVAPADDWSNGSVLDTDAVQAAVALSAAGPAPVSTGGAGWAAGSTKSPIIQITGAPPDWIEPALLSAAILNGYRTGGGFGNSSAIGFEDAVVILVEFSALPQQEQSGGTRVVGDITCPNVARTPGAIIPCAGRVDVGYARPEVLILHELLHAAGFASWIDGHTAGNAVVSGGHWDTNSPQWAIMRAVLPSGAAGLWAKTLDAVGYGNHCSGPENLCPGTQVCLSAVPAGITLDLAVPWRCEAVEGGDNGHRHRRPPDYDAPRCTACMSSVLAAVVLASLAGFVFIACAAPMVL